MDIIHQPIHILHKKRIQGEITTTEILEAVLHRIDKIETQINAFTYQIKEGLYEKAAFIDEKIKRGEKIHFLAGMPIAIKDIFVTKKIPTTCASHILKDYISPYDATLVKKIKDCDVNLIGKLNMDEFAMGSANTNSAFGATKNPWCLSKTPGGSSGGSAAAVASGMSLASFGTDTGGSIRQPAAYCSIIGLKPTYGRVSRYGMIAFASSLDQAGPMTKDVKDAALLLEIIAGWDEKDATSSKLPVEKYSNYLYKDIKGKKIGVIKELLNSKLHSEIWENYQSNIELLKDNGCEIIEVSIPTIKYSTAIYYVIACSEASSNLGRYDGVRYGNRVQKDTLQEIYEYTRKQGFGEEVKLRVLTGTFTLSSGYYDAYYLKATQARKLMTQEYTQAFQKVDLIASPVSPILPFEKDQPALDKDIRFLVDAYTIPANLTKIPAISIPSGFTKENLPLGFQLQGKPFHEGELLQAAYWVEQNTSFKKPPLAL